MMPNRFRQFAVRLLSVNALGVSLASAGEVADFKSPWDNSPMTFELLPGEFGLAPAVRGAAFDGQQHAMINRCRPVVGLRQ